LFILILGTGIASPLLAQEDAGTGEVSVLMDNMVAHVTSIETAYGPNLAGSIARTSRLEAYNGSMPEFETIATGLEGRTDASSGRFLTLLEQARPADPTSEDVRAALNELWVLSVLLGCEQQGIGADSVKQYVLESSSAFVADHGNFFHPNFDESALTAQDYVRIYFSGFGLIVLLQMDGGANQALQLYRDSTELKPFFAQQLVFRAVDMDTAGLPILQEVLFDVNLPPSAREVFYSVLAGKMIGPSGQYGNTLEFSDEWRTTVAGWALQQVEDQSRMDARMQTEFYGVDFEQGTLGPESLLGLIGPIAESQVTSLLNSPELMLQVSGLEAVRWVNADLYPDYAGRVNALAEPMMSSGDFTLALLALNIFEVDAIFTGEPYDETRRARLDAGLTSFCALMENALGNQDIQYLSTPAWLDIAAEGSLFEGLECAAPMIARAIAVDLERKKAGQDIPLPEGEVNILAHFLPTHPELFDQTSETVLGFLGLELDSGDINPFRVLSYVNYARSAKSSGIELGETWLSDLTRIREWADSSQVVIDADQLRAALDELIG
jgi:hypothetical protein